MRANREAFQRYRIVPRMARDVRARYLPFLQGEGLANYLSDPVFRAHLPPGAAQDPRAAVAHFLATYVNPSFTWGDVSWLKSLTRLPLVVKGLLHPDDAALAI